MIVGFMHIPKTGGSAVGYTVERHPGTMIFTHRRDAIGEAVSFKEHKGTFLFAFMRNPFDRLVSAYAYLKAGGISEDDALDARQYVEPYEDFEHFVLEGIASGASMSQIHLRPQTFWISDALDNIIADFIGRFERLQEDFDEVCEMTGIKRKKLPVTRTSEHRPYREYYGNEAVQDVVRSVYARDFEVGEYPTEL